MARKRDKVSGPGKLLTKSSKSGGLKNHGQKPIEAPRKIASSLKALRNNMD
jgi:hypothetical protein